MQTGEMKAALDEATQQRQVLQRTLLTRLKEGRQQMKEKEAELAQQAADTESVRADKERLEALLEAEHEKVVRLQRLLDQQRQLLQRPQPTMLQVSPMPLRTPPPS